MRLFLAIFPPKNYLDYIRDTLRAMDKEKRNVIPVQLDNIHFTVRFIGSKVSVSTKQQLAKQFLKYSGNFSKPTIELGNLNLGFPRQKHPRAIFYDVTVNDELEQLIDQVHKNIRLVGAKDTILWKQKDLNDYHLTVARLKQAAVNNSTIRRTRELIDTIKLPTPEPFTADEMYLVQSNVPRTGAPVYKKLDRIKL
jgi:2'-5' RNA ligase